MSLWILLTASLNVDAVVSFYYPLDQYNLGPGAFVTNDGSSCCPFGTTPRVCNPCSGASPSYNQQGYLDYSSSGSGYVSISSNKISFGTDFSIVTRFRTLDTTNGRTVFYMGNKSTNAQIKLAIDPSRNLVFSVNVGSTTYTATATAIAVNTWITAICSIVNMKATLSLQGSTTVTSSASMPAYPSADYRTHNFIGRNGDLPAVLWNGQIDLMWFFLRPVPAWESPYIFMEMEKFGSRCWFFQQGFITQYYSDSGSPSFYNSAIQLPAAPSTQAAYLNNVDFGGFTTFFVRTARTTTADGTLITLNTSTATTRIAANSGGSTLEINVNNATTSTLTLGGYWDTTGLSTDFAISWSSTGTHAIYKNGVLISSLSSNYNALTSWTAKLGPWGGSVSYALQFPRLMSAAELAYMSYRPPSVIYSWNFSNPSSLGGTINGQAVFGVSGTLFVTGNSFLDISSSRVVLPTAGFTIMVRGYSIGNPQLRETLVDFGGGSTASDDHVLLELYNGAPAAIMSTIGTANPGCLWNQSAPRGTFVEYAMVYQSSGVFTVYMNYQVICTNTMRIANQNPRTVSMIGEGYPASSGWQGVIDHVWVFPNVLNVPNMRNINSMYDANTLRCPSPPITAQQSLGSCGEGRIGTSCKLGCASGYYQSAATTGNCIYGVENADWQGLSSTCLATCPSLPSYNGVNAPSCTGNYAGSTCTFSCATGYTPVGTLPTKTCSSGGTWTGSDPSCRQLQCSALNIANSKGLSCNGGICSNCSQSVCSISCLAGYVLNGAGSLTCQISETWSASIPTCTISQCPALTIGNGTILCSNTNYYQSTCTFSCNPNFVISSNTALQCGTSTLSQWSSTAPTCSLVMCNPLTAPNPGAMQCTGGQFPVPFSSSSYCNFTCPNGYLLKNGPMTLSCTTTGVWSPSSQVGECENQDNCAGAPCGSDCYNRVNAYLCAPYFDPTSLIISNVTKKSTINSSVGKEWVSVGFIYTNTSVIKIISPPALVPTLTSGPTKPCDSWFLSNGRLFCLVPPGMGTAFALTLTFNVTDIGYVQTITSANTFNYTAPTITILTLQIIGGPGPGITQVKAQSDAGDIVAFNGTNFWPSSPYLKVTYGPPGNPTLFTCTVDTNSSTTKRIVCLTQPKSSGINVFAVNGVRGNDTYIFVSPFVDTVTAVSGCQTTAAGVVDCPTAGGSELIVTGFFWDPTTPLSITIGSNPCPNSTAVVCNANSACIVHCTLPVGNGPAQSLVLNTAGLFAPPRSLVWYARPGINSIDGCTATESNLSIVQCTRQGGDSLTITGNNFGVSGASAMIGSVPCLSFTQSVTSPHTQGVCVLPPGSGLGRTVQVFQQTGQVSLTASTVGYTQCPVGMFQNQTFTTCAKCAGGTYSNAMGQRACQICDPGKFSLPGATNCTSCPTGQYQNSTGMSRCVNCPIGTAVGVVGAAFCTLCDSGTYGATTQLTTCALCDVGRYSYLPSGAVTGITACTACNVGTAVNNQGQISCRNCDPGKYSAVQGATGCDLCDVGTFQNISQTSTCMSCATGQLSATAGSTACTLCDPGTVWKGGQINPCAPCPPGSISNSSGSLSCVACDPGSYIQVPGRTTCLPCPSGTYQDEPGASGCKACLIGYFQAGSGATDCDACRVGSYSDTMGRADCPPCSPGQYTDVNASVSCQRCEVGKFSQTNGVSACDDCAPGAYIAVMGGAKCPLCAPGFFSNQSSQTACTQCSPGTSRAANGGVQCDTCPLGKFTALSGQPACTSCPPGKYSDQLGVSACQDCDKGMYQDVPEQTSCKNCPSGTYNPFTGVQACTMCPTGKYMNQQGKTDCQECAPGTSQNSVGKFTCSACNPGYFTRDAGRSDCSPCPTGFAAPFFGTIDCTFCGNNTKCPTCVPAEASGTRIGCVCPVNYYMGSKGECRPCSVGANCNQAGVTNATLDSYTADNWLHLGETYVQCLVPGACLHNACVFPRTGPLCSLCLPGYSLSGWDKACVQCRQRKGSLATTIGAIIGTIAVAFCIVYYLLFRNRIVERGKMAEEAPGGFISSVAMAADGFEMSYAFKILIRFFQVTSALASLPSVKSTNMPTLFVKFLGSFQFLVMDIVPWQSVSCLLPKDFFYTKMVIATVLPALLIALLTALLVIIYFIRQETLTPTIVKYLFIRLAIFATFALYPSVSSVVLSMFACTQVEGKWYVTADFALECYTAQWRKWSYFAIVMIVIYPVGVPLVYGGLLFAKRKQLYTQFGLVALGFLHDAYDRHVWYFELLAMSEKLVMTSLLQFLVPAMQLPVAMGVTGFFLILIVFIQPEKQLRNWRLHMLSTVEVMILIIFWHMQTKMTAVQNLSAVDMVLSLLFIGLALMLIIQLLVNTNKIKEFIEKMPKTSWWARGLAAMFCIRD